MNGKGNFSTPPPPTTYGVSSRRQRSASTPAPILQNTISEQKEFSYFNADLSKSNLGSPNKRKHRLFVDGNTVRVTSPCKKRRNSSYFTENSPVLGILKRERHYSNRLKGKSLSPVSKINSLSRDMQYTSPSNEHYTNEEIQNNEQLFRKIDRGITCLDIVGETEYNIVEESNSIDNNELLKVYGSDLGNWGDLRYFQGGYINFGYWENISLLDELTKDIRKQSSLALYRIIIQDLEIRSDHIVLEVGCGRGVGIIEVLSKMLYKKIIALDMNMEQLKKTNANIEKFNISSKNELKVKYVNERADYTKLESESIDRIYSVEVAQHFDSMFAFAKEMKRILKPDGKLIFTTYFLKEQIDYESLREFLPHIEKNWDKLHLIKSIHNDFKEAGFEESKISYVSIGDNVFAGYDKWLEQTDSNEWSRCFLKAFNAGIIDYGIYKIG
ncbi:MAG: class I SAM-dependent methyltransferase [Neisseriaceae bacterium]